MCLVWLVGGDWSHPILQYDVREDEEQNVKLKESIDLLLAAGYFRARIKGLTPFDKVSHSTVPRLLTEP